ncbi:MAG: glycosyltransferase family 39 protein [Anaerolineales bacterium]|nr:glycosyltransferase family 39 protein [Anaerolineales bacterium]
MPPGAPVRLEPTRAILIAGGILFALVGQVWLYVTPVDPNVALPLPTWLSLLGPTLVAVAYAWPRALHATERSPNRWLSPRQMWIFAGLALSITAAGAAFAFERFAIHQYPPILSLWLLGASCFVIGFLPQTIPWPKATDLWSAHRSEILTLVAVAAFGVSLRFYQLGSLPIVINGDEGLIGMFAQATNEGSLANPFTLWENIGTLYMQLINVALRVFGPSPFSLRLLSAIGGSLAVITTYFLARLIGGRRVAWLAALLLAMSHIHIHFSRTAAVTYIQGTWLVPLELYLLLGGLQRRSAWRAALAGVVLAIHMNVYISAQIATGILLAYTVVLAIWMHREFLAVWRLLAIFWAGFAITVIPQASYMLRQPAELMSRLNVEGTFNSGWLANEMTSTGKPMVQILAERVAHAFLSLIYYPAVDFYGSPVPVLSFVAAVLFLMGLGYVLLRVRTLDGMLLNGYFWGMTVAVGVFAIPPSADSYRMIVALPAAMIMAALGLDQILTQIGLGWQRDRLRYGAVVTIILVGLATFNTWTYFFDFVGRCRYGGDPQTRFASHLGTVVRGVESEGAVYLLSDSTFFYGSHASVDFLTGSRAITNHPDPVTGLDIVSGETVIASTPRIAELLEWTRANPGGELHYQRDCGNIILLAYQMP